MPRFHLNIKDRRLHDIAVAVFEETVILKRQERLTPGRWDFAVFGPDKDETVLREGHADQAMIHRAPVYIASLSKLRAMQGGVPIGEFIGEDVPDEYRDLEIVQVDPLRPLTISRKLTLEVGAEQAMRETEGRNIALIQSPDARHWAISVLRYLHECDSAFPDRVQEVFNALRGGPHSRGGSRRSLN